VTGEQAALLVRRVEGVHKGVDAGAVGAVGHRRRVELLAVLVLLRLRLRSEASRVRVELQVAVSRVVGVYERVEVGVDGGVHLIDVVVVLGCGGGGLLLDSGGGAHRRGHLNGGGRLLSGEGGGVEPVGAGGDVRAVQDAEAVLAGGVLHGVGLAVVADVAVLADALALGAGLLPEDDAVLLGVGGAEAADDLGTVSTRDSVKL